jgi:hypothetical protein
MLAKRLRLLGYRGDMIIAYIGRLILMVGNGNGARKTSMLVPAMSIVV